MDFYIQPDKYKVPKSKWRSGEALVVELVRTDGHPKPDSSKLFTVTAVSSTLLSEFNQSGIKLHHHDAKGSMGEEISI